MDNYSKHIYMKGNEYEKENSFHHRADPRHGFSGSMRRSRCPGCYRGPRRSVEKAETPAAPAASKYDNVLNIGVAAKNISTQIDAVWVNRGDPYKTLMFRSLFIATPDMKGVECDLAESYAVSDDISVTVSQLCT